ncbi:olfactory receptor 4D1-like [Oncorhynchus clarkii lewisi]|uniref:olfactory receptor 4D1-like n=1 Tax=Oncorhynchus clarkii lewisi TaxID=490388 RepID=UPI0039B9439C
MDDFSNVSSVLTLEGFNLSPESAFSAFIFATLSYMVILFCNLVLILTIILNRSLHQPMYLLLLNLPINDLIGSTALFTQLIKELLLDTRTIQYSACVAQAFFIHVLVMGAVFILTVMAYDRYIAICCPLRYNTFMTNAHLRKIVTLLWMCDLILIGVLFFLLLQLPRCRSLMSHSYCDNPSLLKLVCGNTAINNIYGLFITALLQVIVVSTILYTYVQILVTCFRNKGSADTKSKALQTCATHLIVFLLLLRVFRASHFISYRLSQFPPQLRRLMEVSTFIFPPTLNPIIYGLRTKDIRVKAMHFLRTKIFPS